MERDGRLGDSVCKSENKGASCSGGEIEGTESLLNGHVDVSPPLKSG